MAHELAFMRNGRAAMAYVGAKPWHGLGQQLAAGADIDTWQQQAGMSWEIDSAPVAFYDKAGQLQEMTDRLVLHRSDTAAPLGIVSDGYKVVQPKAVLEFFRDVTEEAGAELETAGCLFGGRRFWALARITGLASILDSSDKVRRYLLLATSADGSMATEARLTDIRVVCNNTLGAARVGKGNAVKVSHRTEFDAHAAKATLGIKRGDVEADFDATMAGFRRMASTKLSQAEMVRMTLEAFGHKPDELSSKELQEVAKKRGVADVGHMAVTGRGLLGAGMAGGQGTTWGWLNAVTQYVDHSARANSASNRLDSAWFGRGDALKRRAAEIAQQHAGGAVTVYADAPEGSSSLLDDVLAATLQAA